MIKKILAKKIIIAPPPSTTRLAYFLRTKFGISFKVMDAAVQGWALEQSDFFSREDWDGVQLKKLKKILCHARDNVPYWRNVFERSNFNPKRMQSVSDVRVIPVIHRSELKKIPIEHLLAKNVSKERFISAATSGSTGEPFRFYQDEKDVFRRYVNNAQEFRYVGASGEDPILIIGLNTHSELNDAGARISAQSLESESVRQASAYPLIRSLHPRLLLSAPSYLERFLFFCEKDGFHPKIDRICYMGEQMDPRLKSRLEGYFGAMIYTVYGTRECSLIGIQCKNGKQHLAPWMNFVEIVAGQIVVTTFENEAMPFIRYAIGDEGAISERPCACGRSSRVLEFKGRMLGTVELTDGSHYQMLYIVQYLAKEYAERVVKFQFEQTSFRELCMRYVPAHSEDGQSLEADLKTYFASVFHDRTEVVLQRVDRISPNKAGKVPLFIKNIH